MDWPVGDLVSPEGIGHFRFCDSFSAYHILISIVVRFEFQRVTARILSTFSFCLNPEHKFHPRYKFRTCICVFFKPKDP